MVYHAKHSAEFVGLRSKFDGRKQVVYDAHAGKRVVLNIVSPSASEVDINAALQEGISCRNVLGGVLTALKSRNIDVDFSI